MEKRILFAFLLSLAVLYGSRALFAPKTAPPTTQTLPTSSSSGPAAAPAQSSPSAAKPASTGVAAPEQAVPATDVHAESSEEIVIENELYAATVSNQGAVLKSFKLKKYADPQGKPIELIDTVGAAKVGWPLGIVTQDAKVDDALAAANFRVTRGTNRLEMEFAAAGLHAKKTLTFEPNNYEFSVETAVDQGGRALPHEIVWRSGFGDQSIPPDPSKRQLLYPNGSSYKRLAMGSVKAQQEMSVSRIGLEDQYFLAMFLFPGSGSAVKINKQEYPGPDGKPVPTFSLSASSPAQPVRVYVGPKDQAWLTKADGQLAAVIDYGFFEFITKPLMLALLWVHGYVGNFGWSIILLTAFINLVLFPLRLKQQVSMQKMQTIQPQMRTLQDKYKKLKATDPKRAEIQTQMMGLYKEHGINPMSGCLPLLLQMPFLLAFYKMLSVAIELRQAPWILWIQDLSAHDPYYVMPILMGVSMLITQKMTPTTTDPAQARMMMIMPIMFMALFLRSQSGLMLYWLTTNVVGIGQQFFINKYWAPAKAAPRNRQIKKEERVE